MLADLVQGQIFFIKLVPFCVYVCVHVHVFTCICVYCMCVCVCVCVYMHACVNMPMYVHVSVHSCVFTAGVLKMHDFIIDVTFGDHVLASQFIGHDQVVGHHLL